METADLDQKIQEVYRGMQTERMLRDAMERVSRATNNPDVLRQNEAKIRETDRRLQYFEGTLRDLQARKAQLGQLGQAGPDPSAAGLLPTSPLSGRLGPQASPSTPYDPSRPPGYVTDPSQPHPAAEGALATRPKQYSNLDLIRAETPLNAAKISRMVHQLEFKLQVEKQYKAGIDKMTRAYQADGDRRSRVDTEAKRVESDRKIALLGSALRRYKTLHVLDVADDDEDDSSAVDGPRKENLRNKPLSGKLQITVQGARELEHTPLVNSGKSRSSSKKVLETFVNIKVEGTQHARSHVSRTDRWMEDFEIPVDKANEIEIAIYDKQVGEVNPVPIGLLWIRISDLVEAIRRRKVLMETGQGGWVTAGGMPGSNGGSGHLGNMAGGGDMNAPVHYPSGGSQGLPPNLAEAPQVDGIDGWFAVEPVGALALHLNFVKENVRKRAVDRPGGLGRQGAVRARKDEVHEMNGHKFVQRQFYQIILCAFCGEFLLNAVGYQCEDCKYTCHKKCYEKVVTKCISKSNIGEDEEKINHRIPHRFEPLTNIGANWCCHCGQMLPLGRKNARRCSECDITCHANCAHLVPDFCGMSMETANQLLRNMRAIRSQQDAQGRPLPTKQPSHRPTGSMNLQSSGPQQMTGLNQGMASIRLDPTSPVQMQPSDGPYQRQPQSPPLGVLNAATLDPRYSQYAQQPGQPYQQQPGTQPPRGLPPGALPPQGGHQAPQRPPPGYESQAMLPPGSDLDGSGSLGFDPNTQPALPPKPYPPPPQTGKRTSTLPMSPSQPLQAPPPSKPAAQPQTVMQSPVVPSSISGSPAIPAAQAQVVAKSTRRRKVGLDDFNFLAVLGKGNFGKVMLAEEKKTSELYAIKVLKKEFIIENDEVESTRSEKRVFMTASRERHPFLLDLHSCFQTETRVYFVMEYVSGGDLMLHIQRKQFSLRQAKFYACEVLLALGYFHANGIVYRDLKLDNILLTLDGHVKVADYGLCKEDMWYGSTTSTFCGTPEFMAPEILLEQRYGRAVDWWAFGVLMYEMLLGQSPFRGDDEDEIFDAILEDEPLYPITMPRDAVAILQKLLTRDPNRRLGSGETDAEEIKKQPFFKDVNWDDVFNKRISVSYFPTISGSADTSNFDEEFTREQPTLTPVHGQLSARDQAEFNGFSWVAAWADV